jgi:hypothetical protein
VTQLGTEGADAPEAVVVGGLVVPEERSVVDGETEVVEEPEDAEVVVVDDPVPAATGLVEPQPEITASRRHPMVSVESLATSRVHPLGEA